MKKYRIRTLSSENCTWGVWQIIWQGRQSLAGDTIAKPPAAQ